MVFNTVLSTWRKRNIDLDMCFITLQELQHKKPCSRYVLTSWTRATLVSHELDFSPPATALWLVQQWIHSGIRESSKAALRMMAAEISALTIKNMFTTFSGLFSRSFVRLMSWQPWWQTRPRRVAWQINMIWVAVCMRWYGECPAVPLCVCLWWFRKRIEKGWSFTCLAQYGVSETQDASIPHYAALSTSKSESKTSNDPQSMQMEQEPKAP